MRLLPVGRRERAYSWHVGDVYRYALAVLGDPEDAEEVTYATFVQGRCARLDLNSLLAIAHEVCRLRGRHPRPVEAEILAYTRPLSGSLSCPQAELAISRQLDHRLARRERRLLRAHLRSCEECERIARCQRRQRTALRALAALPVPDALAISLSR